MAKKMKSIYGEEIKKLNISDILSKVLEDAFDPDWYFDLSSNWQDRIVKSLEKLDFHNYNYITDYGVYWSGVLTLEPFYTLENRFSEEEILNIIKNEHLQLLNTDNGLILQFYNPTKSPLYRFFNKHKEDGYGGNVPYSVNVLLSKIKKYFTEEISNNLEFYGEWLPVEDEDIA